MAINAITSTDLPINNMYLFLLLLLLLELIMLPPSELVIYCLSNWPVPAIQLYFRLLTSLPQTNLAKRHPGDR